MRCSVIIPVYNGEKTIGICLDSVLHQSLPCSEYEVIVIDDGSKDNTSEVVKKYSVKLLRQENQGPAAARNRGINNAQGNVLVFTDADCILDYNFLENIISPIENKQEIAGAQGSYKTKQKEFMARFSQVEIETRYERMKKDSYIDFIGTYAAAYRKDVFAKYGGFDTGFPLAVGEDADFSYRLNKDGHKMIFLPEAFVYHHHPTDLRRYLKSKFYRGYWRMRLCRKYPKTIFNDSYVVQSVKFQVISIPFFFLFAGLSLFNIYWLYPLFLIIISFYFYSQPFFQLFKEKKYRKESLIPFVLFLRSISILLGMAGGTVNELLRRDSV